MDDISAYAGLFFAALLAATIIPGSSEVVLGAMVAYRQALATVSGETPPTWLCWRQVRRAPR